MSSGKVMIIHLIARHVKKISLYEMSYYPKQYSQGRSKTKVELDLDNYEAKSGLKGATGIDTSELARKPNLAELK